MIKDLENIKSIAQASENVYVANKVDEILKFLRDSKKKYPNDFDLGSFFRKVIVIGLLFVGLTFSQEAHKVSYYGEAFHGKLTASGEVYDMEDLTCAAIRDYDFGDILKVTNIKNGKSVIVKVNDRGNFRRLGRTLDLSKKAFSIIGNLEKGVLTVKIKKL